MTDPRRQLPSVRALLEGEPARAFAAQVPRPLLTDAVRDAVEAARRAPEHAPHDDDGWRAAIGQAIGARQRRSLRAVLNATGVVLHTNLGRAPLPAVALEAMRGVASGYANLEYDLDDGARGSRYVHCVSLLRELSGAEDALVVNNGAAALVLSLNTLADGREAIVSRGELVEIGGSFRVPDIMSKSGARLVEVGSTNRTHLADYRAALTPETGVIVKVHRSNFAMAGYVADVTMHELATLGEEHGVPVIHDLGSGLLLSLERFGLRGETVAGDAVREGATLVTMSGDKLLGGPQAGIIVGQGAAVARMRKNPLTRALRVDKLTLAALEATLMLYREPERARREIPTLALLCATADSLAKRAEHLADELRRVGIVVTVTESAGSVGGGAFPVATLPGWALALEGNAEELDRKLRLGTTPVVGRIADGRVLLDLRAIPEGADAALAAAVIAALG